MGGSPTLFTCCLHYCRAKAVFRLLMQKKEFWGDFQVTGTVTNKLPQNVKMWPSQVVQPQCLQTVTKYQIPAFLLSTCHGTMWLLAPALIVQTLIKDLGEDEWRRMPLCNWLQPVQPKLILDLGETKGRRKREKEGKKWPLVPSSVIRVCS